MTKHALLLSKTDYKVARECPAKLYYRFQKYPSAKDGDEYMELLAKGGYMIGAIAGLLFPDAVLIDEPDHDKALRITQEQMQKKDVVLLEAAFESNGKFARPDILIKEDQRLTLIEVKAKSFDSSKPDLIRNKKGAIRPDWLPYLEDIAFQALILRELFPQSTLPCELMMPDTAKSTDIDNLYSFFSLNQIAEDDSGYPRARFTFTGDADQLRRSHFLTRINVDSEVAELLPLVASEARVFIQSINPVKKLPAQISFSCKDCEYRVEDDAAQNGFRECWGDLADVKPHVLDLYYGSQIKGMDELIAAGKTSLFDVLESVLRKKDGSVGGRNERQLLQIRHTQSNSEWLNPALQDILQAYAYPLHFIDFETSALAVPYHAGMSPFENVAFQWSCHTLTAPDAEIEHAEWINLEEVFPNFAFAESLMNHLERSGTVFMWATHENTILKDILMQMEGRVQHPALQEWLLWITDKRLVDMNDLTVKYYFHPLMKGRTSIKNVLDAVWQSNPSLHRRFPSYVKEGNGKLLSPHKALPPLMIDGQDVFVHEGTGAITAYQSMLYGTHKGDVAIQNQWKRLLLQYCELDTLAMVMIYWHWLERLENQ